MESQQDGADHPRRFTQTDDPHCDDRDNYSDCTPNAVANRNTWFNSTFDAFSEFVLAGTEITGPNPDEGDMFGVHRLLYPDPWDQNIPNPAPTQGVQRIIDIVESSANGFNQEADMLHVIMLVNTALYGGSGGGDETPFPNLATIYRGSDGCHMVTHEYGHSFAKVLDEYWPGAQFAQSAANMHFDDTGIDGCADSEWAHWCGVENIGYHQHQEQSCETGTLTNVDWFKPTTGGNCKMQAIAAPYCAVCREATVKRFHDLVAPLISFTTPVPNAAIDWTDNDQVVEMSANQSQEYAIVPRFPYENGLVQEDNLDITWTLEGIELGPTTDR